MQVSLWEEESFYAPHDVIIIGAGLAGLWTALELKRCKPSASVLILERGTIPTGASTRNAGFACFGSPTEMISDAATMGENAMWQVVEMRYKGIKKIQQHFGDKVIDMDNCGGYECFAAGDHRTQQVEEKVGWLNKGMQNITGKAGTFAWANDKISSFGFAGFDAVIENRLEGGLHSGKLVQALLQKVVAAGVHILNGIEVKGWVKAAAGIHVQTPAKDLVCSRLIIATNAFLPHVFKNASITPARGQVLVTEPIDNLPFTGTFHFDEGYYYFRNVGKRVLLGGARNTALDEEKTDVMATSIAIQQRLETFLSQHILPGFTYNISHRWSGIMAFTKSKLPVIGEPETGVYTITACNGMGVALTPIVAEIIAQELTGSFNANQYSSSLLLPATK